MNTPAPSPLLSTAVLATLVLGLLAGVHRQRRRSPEAAPTTTAATRWWADGPMIALGPPQSGKTALTPSAVLTSDKSVTIATRRGQAGTGGGDAA